MVKGRTRVCECCGHPLPDSDVELSLTPMQRKIFNALKRSGIAGMTNPRLMDAVYGDDPTGGPENGNVLSVVIKNMRKPLARHGLTIASSGGPGARYHLRTVDPVHADDMDPVEAPLTKLQRRMYRALKRARHFGVRSQDLMDVVYAGDENGGALTLGAVAQMAVRMRKILEPQGLTIRGTGGHDSHYKLEKL